MVLALLVLSASLLVAVSRTAGRTAIAGRVAVEDLQRRWGVASCRKAVLPYAEPMLAALEQERRRAVARFDITVALGGQRFDMTIADEQAKANVNAILAETDVTLTESRLRQGLAGSGLANRVKLRATVGKVVEAIRPAAATQGVTPPPETPTVAAWGQVFEGVPPAQLMRAMPGGRVAALDLLTCWGSGAVNVRRAPQAALAMAAGRSLTGAQIARLIDARDKLWERRPGAGGDTGFDRSPAEAFKELMTKTAGQSIANRGAVGLTEGSRCHSLWVVSRSGRRDWYDGFVRDTTDEQRPVVWAFEW
jgi:hypothetical protein